MTSDWFNAWRGEPALFGRMLLTVGSATLGGALCVIAAKVRPIVPDLPGRVRSRREEALKGQLVLRVAEWGVRWTSGAVWSLPGFRGRAERYLKWQGAQLNLAGYPWTLSAHEFPVVAVGLALSGAGVGMLLGLEVNYILGLLALGPVGAFARIAGLAGDRKREAGRGMPRLMDMLALCMSSGMDLVAALRQVSAGDRGVLADEVTYLLRTLEMGQTRRDALRALGESLPAPEVGDFCRAVIQAEAKGASVREALVQQAAMSRAKRSVRAEEAAARAAILLLGPTLMLVVCIVLLLMGPILIGGTGF
jgi:tight adherence protein C